MPVVTFSKTVAFPLAAVRTMPPCGRGHAEQGNRPYARAYEIVVAEGAEASVAELRPA